MTEEVPDYGAIAKGPIAPGPGVADYERLQGPSIIDLRLQLRNATLTAEDALAAEFTERARCEQRYIEGLPEWGQRGGPGSNEDDRKRLLKLAVADDPECQRLHREYQVAETRVALLEAHIEALYIAKGFQPQIWRDP